MLKHINSKLQGFALIEFWVVTAIIFVALIVAIIDAVHLRQTTELTTSFANGNTYVTGLPVTYTDLLAPILFNYLVTYLCYLLLFFYVAPEFNKPAGSEIRSIVFVLVLIALAILLSMVGMYFAALLALKIWLILFNRTNKTAANALNYESALLTASWIVLVVILSFNAHIYVKTYILLVMPVLIVVYLYAIYSLLPRIQHKKLKFLNFFIRMFGIMILSTIIDTAVVYMLSERYPLGQISLYGTNILSFGINESCIQIAFIGNMLTQLFIVIPVAWNTYKNRNRKINQEINELKTELGQTDASLTFLKSQINPHFLFNALNTLYGTALQENAERTGEGVQKLGDMMRFMLQENLKDKIALTRDVEYLNNYIILQKLRTSQSADVVIDADIAIPPTNLLIAPMLLIPFVENAFKHGISLVNPSFIKISLQLSGNTLYFDVHNTIHLKQDGDPEQGQSGIGLDNVKQRLQLLYAEKHELIIRENAKDFFVHLTLQLQPNE